jgi:diguanylate cyclase (GGDEF)-like protein
VSGPTDQQQRRNFDPRNAVIPPHAQRAFRVLFGTVVVFLTAGAGVAAWNMKRSIGAPAWAYLDHEVLPGEHPIRSVMPANMDPERTALARRTAQAGAMWWFEIYLAASLAVADFLLVASFYRLIVRRQHVERRLKKLAMMDSLTGLANRRSLETALESAVSRATRRKSSLSVLFVDVDHFKQFNDKFGHMTGDQVLRAVARAVRSSVRKGDVAGRFGGEEFLVVLPETDEAGAVGLAERIRAAVRALDLPLPPVTISLGVATLGPQCASVKALVAKADQALHVSKQTGRDRVTHFQRSLHVRGNCAAVCSR